MSQEIRFIKISDLVLWTENPRDPIDINAKDQDIVDMALNDKSGSWNLSRLASQMGDYYDFSEIPIVVYEREKPIVYDGNRRVILAKLVLGLVTAEVPIKNLPSVPEEIPCNVCDKDTAINSVLRKHGMSGSWRPLERDRFILKYKEGEKSDFVAIEEATGLISSHEKMNQGFVKDEVFSPSNLSRLGLRVSEGRLESQHSVDESRALLLDLCSKIERNFLNTRQSRGNVLDILDEQNRRLIESNRQNSFSVVSFDSRESEGDSSQEGKRRRKTRRTKAETPKLFGKDLVLIPGDVNNLYRDICELYTYYQINKARLSSSFPALIRMSLRLLCETAAGGDIQDYLKKHFASAKKTLSQDEKTFLANQHVNVDSITQLLHTGAHNYTRSQNLDQTMAISIILGAILLKTHSR